MQIGQDDSAEFVICISFRTENFRLINAKEAY
jgi:hypothetical protein